MKSTVGDGKRGGLFLERLWRVGELNTADTCQGFFFLKGGVGEGGLGVGGE